MVFYPNKKCGLHPGKSCHQFDWTMEGQSQLSTSQVQCIDLYLYGFKFSSMLITRQPIMYVTSSLNVGFVDIFVLCNF